MQLNENILILLGQVATGGGGACSITFIFFYPQMTFIFKIKFSRKGLPHGFGSFAKLMDFFKFNFYFYAYLARSSPVSKNDDLCLFN